jgi:ribosomal protein S18 acetylase RimI-like enzyme
MIIRDAEIAESGPLAKIWYDGWQDAHARIVPVELARFRTLESFRERLGAALASVRVAGAVDAPVGFCMLKGDELYQLYVSSEARGSGVAAALVVDAEARLSESGVGTAWLACAIGNERAARFYEKCGWRRAGTVVETLEIPNGTFPLEVWRYEKSLQRPATGALGRRR